MRSRQNQAETVVGDRRPDASLTPQLRRAFTRGLFVADDLRAAVREYRPRHRFRGAPVELVANGRMTDANAVSSANDGARQAGTVTDVHVDPAKRLSPLRYRDEVGRVEDDAASGADPVPDGRREERMLHRKGFE